MTDPADLGLAPGPETDRIAALVRSASWSGPPPPWLRIPIGDDAAALDLPDDQRLVISVDASVEDVHFRRAWMTWEVVGYRAAASALSDLAAMAASPIGTLLTVALPPELDAAVAASLGEGFGQCLRACDAILLGGDVVASPGPVFLDTVAVGAAAAPIGRRGARAGDELWVTGELGGAGSAVASLRDGLEPGPLARRAFERPQPRLAEARWLAERAPLHALIDISDGLARDARHLSEASGVRVEIRIDRVPVSRALESFRESEAGWRLAIGGGEDYELLAAAPAGALEPLRAPFESEFGIPLTRVGTFADGSGVEWVDSDGRPAGFVPTGFDHFTDR